MCIKCNNTGWVCEDHPDRPWETGEANDCRCNGAGMPCKCNSEEGLPINSVILWSLGPVKIFKPKKEVK